MNNVENKKMPMIKRMIFYLVLIIISLLFVSIIFQFTENKNITFFDLILMNFVKFIMGMFLLFFGAVSYSVFLLTNCFTFDLKKPFYKGLKVRKYICNVIVLFFLSIGVGFMLTVLISPILMLISPALSNILPISLGVVVVMISSTFILIWKPVEVSLIKKRMIAKGISNDEIHKGYYAGISDPSRSSFKKLTEVEDDIGMLWIHEDNITYIGDSEEFKVNHDQLIDVTRKTDEGSVLALSGVVDIIIKYLNKDDSEKEVRIYSEGHWTSFSAKKGFNDLANKLISWKSKIK